MKSTLLIIAFGVIAVQATPIIPHQECRPDPLPVAPGTMNVSLNPLFAMMEGSNHQGVIATGINGVVTDISVIIITLTVNFNIQVPTLDIVATGYDATGYIDARPFTSIPSGNYTGRGNSNIRIRGLEAIGSAVLFVNIIGNKVTIRTLRVDSTNFDDVCLNFGPDFQIGENPVDWDDFCANFKSRYEAEWNNNSLKNGFVEKIRLSVNGIIGNFTLDELLELINQPQPVPCVN